MELNLALLHDFCGDAFCGEAEGASGASSSAKPSPALRPETALQHYARAAHLDGADRRVWQLWAACSRRCRGQRGGTRAASAAGAPDVVAEIHQQAVARGVWLRVEQRPLQLVPALALLAMPWHDASGSPVCVALARHFVDIKEEVLALIAAEGTQPFGHARAGAAARGLAVLAGGQLARGKWLDISLFTNGRRHEANAARLPLTAALLASDEGGLRRDATSCPLGHFLDPS